MRKNPYTLRFHTNEYQYLGNFPSERTNQWAENAQGVTTDGEHWFLSNDARMFKYHVLTSISSNNSIIRTGMPDNLRRLGYTQFKALCFHGGFLFVPLKSGGANPPAIGMFRATDLSYVAHVELDPAWELGTPGWLAIHPREGRLYTSASKVDYGKGLKVFDFTILANQSGFTMSLSHELVPRLQMPLNHMQGGIFSPEGQLYLINGYLDSNVSKGGISVFGMHDFHFRQKSAQRGDFRFQWDTHWTVQEEPEGICFWDLDEDDRAPHVKGQLHAILLDNDAGPDDVYMKHYRMSDPVPIPIPEFSLRHSYLSDEPIPQNLFPPNTVRGITHDHQARFFATTTGLYKRPLVPDNPTGIANAQRDWPDSLAPFNHIGDICQADGYLFVPFSSIGQRIQIAVFSAEDLELISILVLLQRGLVALIAFDGRTRKHLQLFTPAGNISQYFIQAFPPEQLRLQAQGAPYRLDDTNAPQPINNITGGEISAVSGFHYIAHDGHISVFHSDRSFVDASALEYNLGEATFDGDAGGFIPKLIATDPWLEPFPPGINFENIPDVQAFMVDPNTGNEQIRSWEIASIRLVGNKRSKELHQKGCPFQRLMAPSNYVPFKTVQNALDSGYNGCYYCMKRHDTG